MVLEKSGARPGQEVELNTETFEALKAVKDRAPPLNKHQQDAYLNFYKGNIEEVDHDYLFSYNPSLNNSNISEAGTDDDPLLLS